MISDMLTLVWGWLVYGKEGMHFEIDWCDAHHLEKWGTSYFQGRDKLRCIVLNWLLPRSGGKCNWHICNKKQTASRLASLCLIMPQVVKSEHLMHYQWEKCQKMPIKGGWAQREDPGCRMGGMYMNGSDKISQDFYDHPEFPGWFKGMKNIIHEHGLWPNNGLKAQCDSFKCISGHTNCCSHWVLFFQTDSCL